MNFNDEYWQSLEFSNKDIESIYNYLLEIETPLPIKDLIKFLIENHIKNEKNRLLQTRKSDGTQYFPKDKFKKGQALVFPHRNYQKGKVQAVRPGNNPEYPELEVITVEFAHEDVVDFASNLSVHILNEFQPAEDVDAAFDPAKVEEKFGESLAVKLEKQLAGNDELINIAGNYFPRSLLVDVSVGHLNLAEAVLEMADGGPMLSCDLINQIELPTDVNANLTEFSMNYALQEDPRFDEVGPAGETLWFLQRLEPDEVQNVPLTLKYGDQPITLPDDLKQYTNFGLEFNDELEPGAPCGSVDEVTISLTYPHWRAGTLPLTNKLKGLFPTAFETPRVMFTFRNAADGSTFNGWVVRPARYVYGLTSWYADEGFIPGSLIHIKRGDKPGEIVISADKKHTTKDWLKTLLVGTDGGYVFATLKHSITSSIDDRMAIVTPDVKAVDAIWEKYQKTKPTLEKITVNMMRELSKLNPQGHIHALELYSAVNLVKRCPPSPIVELLFTRPWSNHLGDLYFRLDESKIESK
jgi:hypothetical protein